MSAEKIKSIELNEDELPIIIQFKHKGLQKNYVLKTNKEGCSLFINKIEDYSLLA